MRELVKGIEVTQQRAQGRCPYTCEVVMSQEHVDVVRGMYAACARGDVSTILAVLDPQVQWWEAENLLYADGNPYSGPDAVFEGVFMRIG